MYYFDYKLIGFTPYNKWGDCIAYSAEEVSRVFSQLSEGYRLLANDDRTYKLVPIDTQTLAKNQAQARIAELKGRLSETDYQAIKFAEGELSAEDYAEMKAQRAEWRKEINELEEKIASQQ